jgi:EAL domain-containing protein (putative c-di-GMP-specific phosphodiesterase class I)
MLVVGDTADRRAAADRRGRGRRIEELSAAITQDQVEILFQPQFASRDNGLVGAEALSRWNHPRLGRIGAEALFDIAERSHHAAELTRHIAGRALAETGFPAERLTLEITEQALVTRLDSCADRLEQLTMRGIGIALDDFGAGFCNFRYLKELPLNGLKLDRSMIEGIDHDPRDRSVLRGIVAMARSLDLKVTAEGIERATQLDVIVCEGCEIWQGFLGAVPLTAEAFAALARG